MFHLLKILISTHLAKATLKSKGNKEKYLPLNILQTMTIKVVYYAPEYSTDCQWIAKHLFIFQCSLICQKNK